jgi:hypothetical protein
MTESFAGVDSSMKTVVFVGYGRTQCFGEAPERVHRSVHAPVLLPTNPAVEYDQHARILC